MRFIVGCKDTKKNEKMIQKKMKKERDRENEKRKKRNDIKRKKEKHAAYSKIIRTFAADNDQPNPKHLPHLIPTHQSDGRVRDSRPTGGNIVRDVPVF